MHEPARQIIWLNRAAPDKPPEGVPCNGCGLCCAAMPCPLSRALLGHRRNACPALQWHADAQHYRCGLIAAPQQYLRWLPRVANSLFRRFARRYLAIGQGCDSDVDLETGIDPEKDTPDV